MGNTSILRLRGSLVAAERYVFKKRMARIGWYADDIWFVATEYLVGMLCIYWPSICTESILQLFIYLFIYLERFSESVQITKKSIIGNLLTSIQSINDKRLQLWSHLPSFCYFMSRLSFTKYFIIFLICFEERRISLLGIHSEPGRVELHII